MQLARARQARRELETKFREEAGKLEDKARLLVEQRDAPDAAGESVEAGERRSGPYQGAPSRRREGEAGGASAKAGGKEAGRHEMPTEVPMWARVLGAVVITYGVLVKTVFRDLEPLMRAAAASEGEAAPAEESVPAPSVRLQHIRSPSGERMGFRGQRIRSARLPGDGSSSVPWSELGRAAALGAEGGMQAFSGGVGLAAEVLPMAGDAAQLALGVAVPAFQAGAGLAARAARTAAAEVASEDFLLPHAVPEELHAPLRQHVPGLLHGAASALDMMAEFAPEAKQAVVEGAAKAMPGLQAAMRATSTFSARAAETFQHDLMKVGLLHMP